MVISKRPPQDPHHLLNQALISTEVLVEPHIRYSTLGESETSFKLLFLFFFISVEFAFVCSNENKSTKFCDLSYEISCFCCQLFQSVLATQHTERNKTWSIIQKWSLLTLSNLTLVEAVIYAAGVASPIKILQRKFYATLLFKHPDWFKNLSSQSECLKNCVA